MHILLLAVLLFQVSTGGKELSGFVGDWMREDVVAENGKHLPKVTWRIAVDEKLLTLVEISEEGKPGRTATYSLDGTEIEDTVSIPNRGKRTYLHKLTIRSANELELREVMPQADATMSFAITENWKLSNHGKTLNMVRRIRPTDEAIALRIQDVIYSFQKVQEKR